MNEHQKRRASRYYESHRPRLNHEHMMDMTAMAARLHRQLEERAREQRESHQCIVRLLTRLQEQQRQGGPMLTQQAAIKPAEVLEALHVAEHIGAAMGEPACLQFPLCVAPEFQF